MFNEAPALTDTLQGCDYSAPGLVPQVRTLSFAEWQAKVKSPEYRTIEKTIGFHLLVSRKAPSQSAGGWLSDAAMCSSKNLVG